MGALFFSLASVYDVGCIIVRCGHEVRKNCMLYISDAHQMQQFFKEDENWCFCSLATDGSVVCFKMRTSQNTAYVLDVCVCACVRACARALRQIQDLQPNTIPTARWDICLIQNFTWCWIGRNRPITFPLCFTGLTPWNFSFGAVWNTLYAPNLLLIIRTRVTETQKLFRLWNPILCVWFNFRLDLVRAARSVHAGTN